MSLQARLCRLLVVRDGNDGFEGRGILQRTFMRLRWLVMIILRI